MNAVFAVQLFILVWTFTAVCEGVYDSCNVSCGDVTGTVMNEVTFYCSVPQSCDECSIENYKLKYPESSKNSTTSDQKLPYSFTCSYLPTTKIQEKFRFFVQTKCGPFHPEFFVNISDPLVKSDESKDAVIMPVVAVFIIIIIILIIILMTIICKKHNNDNSNCPI